MNRWLLLGAVCLLQWVGFAKSQPPAINENWSVPFPNVGSVVLEAPSLDSNQSPDEQFIQLQQLAGHSGWKRFSRNSPVAPVAIKMASIKNQDGERIGHALHVAFVIHAGIQTLRNENLMRELFADEAQPDRSEPLAEQELTRHGIEPDDTSKYAPVELALLKKVALRGTMRIQRFESEHELRFRFRIDPRFNTDQNCNNAWSRISPSEPAQADWVCYDGFAGYIAVTEIAQQPGSCLIESRIVIHEPQEWFGGSGQLRSKLPLITQEGARRFRRKIKSRTNESK